MILDYKRYYIINNKMKKSQTIPSPQIASSTCPHHSIGTMRFIYIIFAICVTQRVAAIVVHFVVGQVVGIE